MTFGITNNHNTKGDIQYFTREGVCCEPKVIRATDNKPHVRNVLQE